MYVPRINCVIFCLFELAVAPYVVSDNAEDEQLDLELVPESNAFAQITWLCCWIIIVIVSSAAYSYCEANSHDTATNLVNTAASSNKASNDSDKDTNNDNENNERLKILRIRLYGWFPSEKLSVIMHKLQRKGFCDDAQFCHFEFSNATVSESVQSMSFDEHTTRLLTALLILHYRFSQEDRKMFCDELCTM